MNDSTGRMVIGFNKRWLLFTLLGAAILVAAGIYIWVLADNPDTPAARRSAYRIVGAAVTILFSLGFLAFLYKLLQRQPALVIDDQGVIDQASGITAGRIPWEDITGFEIVSVGAAPLFVVHVANPNDYLSRAGAMKRKVGEANLRRVGSPIAMSANFIDADIDELCLMLAARLEERKPNADTP